MDAFPDYTRFDKTKKVLAAIQIIADLDSEEVVVRETTPSAHKVDNDGIVYDPNNNNENGTEPNP
jgi:hypothetical protein